MARFPRRHRSRPAYHSPTQADPATEAANWQTFAAAFPGASAWMDAHAEGNHFARSVRAQIRASGRWTVSQLDALGRCMARATAEPIEMDDSRIRAALDRAHAAGLARPKIRVPGFTFSMAGATSRNPGAVYVFSTDKTYLGKSIDGLFQQSRDCTYEIAAAILDATDDPAAAAVAYGRSTGSCSCCGRTLTDPESIAAGIGPVCAAKFGF